MRTCQKLIPISFVLFATGLIAPYATPRPSVVEKVFSFNGPDGGHPLGGVTLYAGRLFGTTWDGGNDHGGTVFEAGMTGEGFAESVIHFFVDVSDGAIPEAAPAMDSAGNLFGTTSQGDGYGCSGVGCGTVYEMSPQQGSWSFQVIHAFTGGTDGFDSRSIPLIGKDGSLFGTATRGGANDDGIVFELSPSNGGWTETILYTFTGGTDGGNPSGTLIRDAAGNLYGTTIDGGVGTCYSYIEGCGVVFELSPSNGAWSETVLYSFTGTNGDGEFPLSPLTFDPAGNLYGATEGGGGTGPCFYGFGCGTVFELSPANGAWKEKILYAFQPTNDGNLPSSEPVFDSAGNIFGTTSGGETCDVDGGCGVVYALSPENGTWKERLVHIFPASSSDGEGPEGNLAMDRQGDLFGATCCGGALSRGTIFAIRP